jgi:hypothetical protein
LLLGNIGSRSNTDGLVLLKPKAAKSGRARLHTKAAKVVKATDTVEQDDIGNDFKTAEGMIPRLIKEIRR